MATDGAQKLFKELKFQEAKNTKALMTAMEENSHFLKLNMKVTVHFKPPFRH